MDFNNLIALFKAMFVGFLAISLIVALIYIAYIMIPVMLFLLITGFSYLVFKGSRK
jgi:hypothetical protein